MRTCISGVASRSMSMNSSLWNAVSSSYCASRGLCRRGGRRETSAGSAGQKGLLCSRAEPAHTSSDVRLHAACSAQKGLCPCSVARKQHPPAAANYLQRRPGGCAGHCPVPAGAAVSEEVNSLNKQRQ